MTSRLKLLVILPACILSLLPVLYVNNALDIAEIAFLKGDPGAPVIEVNVEDPCNSITDVMMTVEITADEANLDIKSSVVDHPAPCKGAPFALITTSNLHLRTPDGRVVERSFRLGTGPTIAKAGSLERTAGGSSTFAVPLAGDSDARYQFASTALKAGFGESALQVQMMARNLSCSQSDTAVKLGQASAENEHCTIPLRAVLQYANAAFDVAAALPPTYYLLTGPNVGRRESTISYSTTRLLAFSGLSARPLHQVSSRAPCQDLRSTWWIDIVWR